MKYTFLSLLLGMFLICLNSCDNNLVFEKYKPIQNAKWHKDSVIVFKFPVTDTINQKNLLVDIRNEINYNYSNLWLFIEMVAPDGNTEKDTFGLTLANPAGKWLGEGFGKKRTQQVIYKRNMSFPISGEYIVKIQHGMRDEILEGISDVGFRVEKNTSETSE